MQLSELPDLAKKHALPLIFLTAGMIFFVYGLIQLLGTSAQKDDSIVFEQSATTSATTTAGKIKVDIEGAVAYPGVYELESNSRVEDAIEAAGGLAQAADRGWIAKNLNLASKVIDGGKLYLPAVGETVPAGSNTNAGLVQGATSILVSINSGSSSQLEALPGIGPVTAQKIIDSRPYSSVDELKTRKVVSNSVFEKIKDKITVN